MTWSARGKVVAASALAAVLAIGGFVPADAVPATAWVSAPTSAPTSAPSGVTVSAVSSVLGNVKPALAKASRKSAIQLGMKFVPRTSGRVVAIRFYKGSSANSGVHVGRLWTSGGRKLAEVKFSKETSKGWQTATLAKPVALTKGKTYVVSYSAPKGRYSVTKRGFTKRRSSTYFTVPAKAGVYRTGKSSKFPKKSGAYANYFVDVVFEPTVATASVPSPTSTPVPPTKPAPTPSPTPTAPVNPTVIEEFNGPWETFPYSPNRKWRIAGDWTGTGGNLLLQANASVAGGVLSLTSRANSKRGAEIQTPDAGYRHGYYVVRMKTTKVPGVCQSFFWKAKDYAAPEIDFEFLTGGVTNGRAEDWVNSADRGRVYITAHPWQVHRTAGVIELGFNPSNAFHNYGFLWTPTSVTFTVDGQVRARYTTLPRELGATAPMGYIMANSWTGAAGWGGGPPTADATAQYEWIKYYEGVTEIPAGAG